MGKIVIDYCTPRQTQLLNELWTLESWDQVREYIASKSESDQLQCLTLIEAVKWAQLDDINDLSDAREYLTKFYN